MRLLITLLTLSFVHVAAAALPPSRMIFQRLAENSGSGSYTIEQEVQIPNGAEPLVLKETWVIDSDRSMRVTVQPMQDPKDSVHLQILYVGGQRWILRDGTKLSSTPPTEFVEKIFHLRSLESAGSSFTSLGILPPNALQKRPLPKKSEDIKHDGEDFVRLGRTDGVIAWAFGQPAPPQGEGPAGLWIEQDQFVIRKLRWSTGAEVSAESYSTYARGLQFPRLRTLRWGNQSVQIRVLSVSGKGLALSMSSLDVPWKIHGLEQQPAQRLIEEFYSRFR